MTTDEKLKDLAIGQAYKCPAHEHSGGTLEDYAEQEACRRCQHEIAAILAALRKAHALGRDEERKRCAEVCRARAKDADAQIVDGTPGHKAVLLGVRYAEATACAKAIEEGKG